MKFKNVLWVFFFSFQPIVAFSEAPEHYAGKSEMNGYQLKDYKNFEKNWKMVTVRFRKDTGELRFTYANKIAWKALQAGGTSYPDGAIFAKIGLATHEDPAFASSAVPSGTRRFQLMVKDSKKHKETEGWGYALFDENGKTFPGEPRQAVLACAACHRIVPDRGYVFSQAMELSPFTSQKSYMQNILEKRIQYKTVKVAELPESVHTHIPAKAETVQQISGPLSDALFEGTLDEIRPSLYKETLRTKNPSLIVNKSGDSFSITYLAEEKGRCADSEVAIMSIMQSPLKKKSSHIICFKKDAP